MPPSDRASSTLSPTGAGACGPLSAEHLRELAEARVRARKVRRAAAFAALSGWTLAVFAFLTLAGAVFGDLAALILGAALAAVAWNELRGAAMLRRFEPEGPRRLGYNQIALAVLIVAYAGWSLAGALRHPMLGTGAGATGDPQTDAMLGNLGTMVALALYGGMAVVGLIAPGLTALYYFTRGRMVRAMLDGTPEWVVQTMRAAA